MSYSWTVKITVDPLWVADGLNLDETNLKEAILSEIVPFAHPNEIEVEILNAPSPESIAEERGYYNKKQSTK